MLAFHGNPASRRIWATDGAAARGCGVRLVAPDRPGFGRSDPQPGRGHTDWATDVAALTDHLGIGKFAVVGVSGGGPFALACAWRLTGRVTAVALVATGPPVPAVLRRCSRGVRAFFFGAHRFPWWLRRRVRALPGRLRADPDGFVRRMFATYSAADRALAGRDDLRARLRDDLLEAFRQGADASAHELALYARPWPVPLQEVTVPVRLWHGREDTVVPPVFGEYLAAALPRCEARFPEGAGHLWFLDHGAEILSDVSRAEENSR